MCGSDYRKTNQACTLVGISKLIDGNDRECPIDPDHELKDKRPYHWDLSIDDDELMNSENDNNDDNAEQVDDDNDVIYSDKEKKIMQKLSWQRHKTIEDRLIDSVSRRTNIQYIFPNININNKNKINNNNNNSNIKNEIIKIKKENTDNNDDNNDVQMSTSIDELNPVAIPTIGSGGNVELEIYHPFTQTMDHIEYEPTEWKNNPPTDTLFDDFQMPIEPLITPYSPKS